jgi:hypothetical protein
MRGAASPVLDRPGPTPGLHPQLPGTLLMMVMLRPHLGHVTDEGYRIFYGQPLEDAKAWLAAQPGRVLPP